MERGEAQFDRTAYMRDRHRRLKGPAKVKDLPIPLPEDAVPDGLCRRCGLVGAHATAGECIDALRGLVAELEFKASPQMRG